MKNIDKNYFKQTFPNDQNGYFSMPNNLEPPSKNEKKEDSLDFNDALKQMQQNYEKMYGNVSNSENNNQQSQNNINSNQNNNSIPLSNNSSAPNNGMLSMLMPLLSKVGLGAGALSGAPSSSPLNIPSMPNMDNSGMMQMLMNSFLSKNSKSKSKTLKKIEEEKPTPIDQYIKTDEYKIEK